MKMTRKNFTNHEANQKSFSANEMLANTAMNQIKGGKAETEPVEDVMEKGTPATSSTTIAKPTSV